MSRFLSIWIYPWKSSRLRNTSTFLSLVQNVRRTSYRASFYTWIRRTLLVQVQVQHWRENGFARRSSVILVERETHSTGRETRNTHECKVDAPCTMRLQLETRNRRAGCAGSDEWASSKNLQPEIFVILKWNCLRARTPWHNSLLPFEIVRSIGVPSPNISCEVVNEVVEHLNESSYQWNKITRLTIEYREAHWKEDSSWYWSDNSVLNIKTGE